MALPNAMLTRRFFVPALVAATVILGVVGYVVYHYKGSDLRKWATHGTDQTRTDTTSQATGNDFDALKKQLGFKQDTELGEGAFISPNGDVVTRKDYKVLAVDPSKLPAQFGQPPADKAGATGQAFAHN